MTLAHRSLSKLLVLGAITIASPNPSLADGMPPEGTTTRYDRTVDGSKVVYIEGSRGFPSVLEIVGNYNVNGIPTGNLYVLIDWDSDGIIGNHPRDRSIVFEVEGSSSGGAYSPRIVLGQMLPRGYDVSGVVNRGSYPTIFEYGPGLMIENNRDLLDRGRAKGSSQQDRNVHSYRKRLLGKELDTATKTYRGFRNMIRRNP